MAEKYLKLWGSMHDNLHHDQMDEIDEHVNFIREVFDFWPIAYYPYGMVSKENNFKVEELLDDESIQSDWNIINKKTKELNNIGYPMFSGYEWQGSGLDGDHNIFFLENDEKMYHPYRYEDLEKLYKDTDFIAIPHHIAYHLGDRGKNWETHNEKISPFAEIYSSHGLSETDFSSIEMNRHIHMGPRVENTSYRTALQKGIKIGCICSGDNHKFSGQYDNGTLCVLAEDKSKKSIWDAFLNRRVYGVTKGRIDVDFKIDGNSMGSEIIESDNSLLEIDVIGDYAIDRIEILKDEVLYKGYYHSGNWENDEYKGKFNIKVKTEFGWGPDLRIFPDIVSSNWDISVNTSGIIKNVQKNWNTFGQKIIEEKEKVFKAKLITRKTTDAGKWMGNSSLKNEGFTFEFYGSLDDYVNFTVFGNEYKYNFKDLLEKSYLHGDLETSKKLIKERFNFTEHYRNDTWWHNANKFKIYQAVPEKSYTVNITEKISTVDCKNIRIKIFQKNGAIAFVSPIFVRRENE